MASFLSIFLITFLVISGVAFLINFCRKRLSKTPHPLTGMCSRTGAKMCSSCGEKLQNP